MKLENLLDFVKYPAELLLTPLALGRAFSSENFSRTKASKNPFDMGNMLSYLHEHGLLTAEILAYIDQFGDDAIAVGYQIVELYRQGLCTDEHIAILKKSTNIAQSIRAYSRLHRENLLNETTKQAILAHKNPEMLTNNFSLMHRGKIALTEELIRLVSRENIPGILVPLLLKNQSLIRFLLPLQKRLDTLRPLYLLFTLMILHSENLLTEKNIEALSLAQDPFCTAGALKELNQHKLLTEVTRELVQKHPDPLLATMFLVSFHSQNSKHEKPPIDKAAEHIFYGNYAFFSPDVNVYARKKVSEAIKQLGETLVQYLNNQVEYPFYFFEPEILTQQRKEAITLLVAMLWPHIVKGRTISPKVEDLLAKNLDPLLERLNTTGHSTLRRLVISEPIATILSKHTSQHPLSSIKQEIKKGMAHQAAVRCLFSAGLFKNPKEPIGKFGNDRRYDAKVVDRIFEFVEGNSEQRSHVLG